MIISNAIVHKKRGECYEKTRLFLNVWFGFYSVPSRLRQYGRREVTAGMTMVGITAAEDGELVPRKPCDQVPRARTDGGGGIAQSELTVELAAGTQIIGIGGRS